MLKAKNIWSGVVLSWLSARERKNPNLKWQLRRRGTKERKQTLTEWGANVRTGAWRKEDTLTKLHAAPNSLSKISFFFFFVYITVLFFFFFCPNFNFFPWNRFLGVILWQLDTGWYGLCADKEAWWREGAFTCRWRFARDGTVLLPSLRVCL